MTSRLSGLARASCLCVCVVNPKSHRERSWGTAVGEEGSPWFSPVVHSYVSFVEAFFLLWGLTSGLPCSRIVFWAQQWGWATGHSRWRTALSHLDGSWRGSCGLTRHFPLVPGPASGWPCHQLSVPVWNANLHKEGLVCRPGSEISTWICGVPAECCNHWAVGSPFTPLRLNVALCCLGFYSPRPASERFCHDRNSSFRCLALVSGQVGGGCPRVNPSVSSAQIHE